MSVDAISLRVNGDRPERRARRAGGRRLDRSFDRVFRLLRQVSAWCEQRSDRVAECYFVPGYEDINLYVIGRGEAFDFELNKELADLTIHLVRRKYPVVATLLPAGSAVTDRDLGAPLGEVWHTRFGERN